MLTARKVAVNNREYVHRIYLICSCCLARCRVDIFLLLPFFSSLFLDFFICQTLQFLRAFRCECVCPCMLYSDIEYSTTLCISNEKLKICWRLCFHFISYYRILWQSRRCFTLSADFLLSLHFASFSPFFFLFCLLSPSWLLSFDKLL